MKIVRFYTSKGIIEAELYTEDAPATIENFIELIENGFYNGLIFYQFVHDTLVKTGCPKGDGTSGPGYFIKSELNGLKQFHDIGVLSMCNVGLNTSGSQFIICLDRNNVAHLDGNQTCFGKIRNKSLDELYLIRRYDFIEKAEIDELDDNIDLDAIS
ncbi:MAG: peptidylprolyl isomerase [Bacteroidota bacterium]